MVGTFLASNQAFNSLLLNTPSKSFLFSSKSLNKTIFPKADYLDSATAATVEWAKAILSYPKERAEYTSQFSPEVYSVKYTTANLFSVKKDSNSETVLINLDTSPVLLDTH